MSESLLGKKREQSIKKENQNVLYNFIIIL